MRRKDKVGFILGIFLGLFVSVALGLTEWDKTQPAAGIAAKNLDNLLRDNFIYLEAAIDQDHDFTSGGTQTGKHNIVSFIEAADIGTGAAGLPILGAQTVSGKAELVFTDEDDNDIQITTGGNLSVSGLGNDSITHAHIELGKNAYLIGSDNAETGDVNLIKANASDAIELGTNTTVNGTLTTTGAIAAGSNKLTGLVDGTASGDALHFAQVDDSSIEMDGSDNISVKDDGVTNAMLADAAALTPDSGSDTAPYGTLVLDGGVNAMTTSWTDLNLDSVASTGAQKTLVFLKTVNNSGATIIAKFRPNGSTEDVGRTDNRTYSCGTTSAAMTNGESNFCILMTDSSGIIEYRVSAGTRDIDVFLMGYVR